MYTCYFVQLRRSWRSRPGRGRGESGSERADSRDLGRGGNQGSRRQELVTTGVQALATPLDLGGPNGTRGWVRKVPEKAEKQG